MKPQKPGKWHGIVLSVLLLTDRGVVPLSKSKLFLKDSDTATADANQERTRGVKGDNALQSHAREHQKSVKIF